MGQIFFLDDNDPCATQSNPANLRSQNMGVSPAHLPTQICFNSNLLSRCNAPVQKYTFSKLYQVVSCMLATSFFPCLHTYSNFDDGDGKYMFGQIPDAANEYATLYTPVCYKSTYPKRSQP